MSAQMCVQSFVALRCILRKPYGFLDPGKLITATRSTSVVCFLGPAFLVELQVMAVLLSARCVCEGNNGKETTRAGGEAEEDGGDSAEET